MSGAMDMESLTVAQLVEKATEALRHAPREALVNPEIALAQKCLRLAKDKIQRTKDDLK